MKDIVQVVMNKFRSIYQGFKDFSDGPEPSVRDEVVTSVLPVLSEYSMWYDQRGLHLPPDYATDPSSWNEALHKMKRAFHLLQCEMEKHGELWEAKQALKESVDEAKLEKIQKLEEEIKEGFNLFGSQLYYMTDNWEGVESGH